MSTPGEPSQPYGLPQPNPYGQVPAPPQNPVPAQQNPYAQQNPVPGQPGPAAGPQAPMQAPMQPPSQPPAGHYGYPPAGLGAPGAPAGTGGVPGGIPSGSGGGGGRGASGWLWAIGGAVAASAIWGSLLFATGGFSSEPSPDLAGYAYTDDLCAATSMTPFENAHYKTKANTGSSSKDANPQHSGARLKSMDTMWCNVSLEQENASSATYSSTWLYNSATLHRKADPAPEFADNYRAYEKQETSVGYKVESVPGIGDEAYLVTRNDMGSDSGSYVILGVREGWMTFQSTWSSYASGSSSGKQPTSDEVATMLKTSATETLKRPQNAR
ncbi:hypothetical protein [Streptomyces sp. NRRL S-1448]|uniref:hypothetical protein n=1 Tax=Streptomyces sp. NRRL S-1448 TaxID=1463883 RepID=UPI0022773EC9|nr:hypothetical protein [Streptomyces sp. NRRL S-1448]